MLSADELVKRLHEYCLAKRKLSNELQYDILYTKEYMKDQN